MDFSSLSRLVQLALSALSVADNPDCTVLPPLSSFFMGVLFLNSAVPKVTFVELWKKLKMTTVYWTENLIFLFHVNNFYR